MASPIELGSLGSVYSDLPEHIRHKIGLHQIGIETAEGHIAQYPSVYGSDGEEAGDAIYAAQARIHHEQAAVERILVEHGLAPIYPEARAALQEQRDKLNSM